MIFQLGNFQNQTTFKQPISSSYLVISLVVLSSHPPYKSKVSCNFGMIFDSEINVINKYSDRIIYEFQKLYLVQGFYQLF